MLRRSILELSSRQSFRRNPTWISTQIPSHLSFRKQYSVASEQNAPQGSGSTGKPPESGSYFSKVIIGILAFGAAVAAYRLNEQSVEAQRRRRALESVKIDPVDLSKNIKDLKEDKPLGGQNVMSSIQESNVSSPNTEPAEKNIETHSDLPHLDDLSRSGGESQFQVKDETQLTPEEDITPIQEKELPSSSPSIVTSDDESKTSGTSLDERLDVKSTNMKPKIEQHEAVESTTILTEANAIPEENEMKSTSPGQQTATDMPGDAHGGVVQPSSLLDEYYLRDMDQATISTLSDKHKDLVGASEDSNDVYISKDGKLVLDFIQAIHAAEKRQAELDAHIFAEEKRKLKEKYEKELKDTRARELMYAEEAAILDKELNRERVKAAAALKSLQGELEEKLRMELEQKEAEAELQLKKIQELAKAELAAAIASEKAFQIEKMAEANLHINALCMAFYARSEEARQSHSVHKLALGALALEDALSKGLPIQQEIEALHTYLEGIDKDPLLDLVLSSLPEETRSTGTDTTLQLKHKFDALKGTLRHFSMIPPGGGGILAHSLAHVASLLKVKEADQSGDGIESLINRVESFLAEGKLSEAADTLENGVKGTKAAEVISDWLRRARDRAIAEQALTMLQSYATAISGS
ncbi:MICOS complex subunit mic60 [Camellia lanceoleosa]|uniref:MICOS complex subunit mic60 n=1 Tax=Camellia lanceoleosa TaxID=1840588 RepID=A0ACC0IYC2_9ERIC|nr:MICOS complex subunit mic60 [Camellia lanceoleosa]